MKKILAGSAMLVLFAFGPAAHAERVAHAKGIPSETLEEAVKNFSEYNVKLAEILAKGQLSDADLGNIHILTYTIENALGKINEDMAALADTLEELHIASETAQYAVALEKGREYLSVARKIVD